MTAEPVALVIDDDLRVHDAVEAALVPALCSSLLRADAPGEGIRLAFEHRPSVILLDVNMPGIDGLKVCRILKENRSTRDIPVLFITIDRKVEHLVQALDCGAEDYIPKPFHPLELRARVRAALRSLQLVDLLREQARIDALTGLHNRAALEDSLRAVVAAHDRTGCQSSVLMIDIDHFKEINDKHGHGVGDDVLREVGAVIQGGRRPYDTACRYGGDEFVVIYSQVDREGALAASRRLLQSLSNARVAAGGGDTVAVRVSAGLVSTEGWQAPLEASELLSAADAALYRAKQAGRDRLEVGEPPA